VGWAPELSWEELPWGEHRVAMGRAEFLQFTVGSYPH